MSDSNADLCERLEWLLTKHGNPGRGYRDMQNKIVLLLESLSADIDILKHELERVKHGDADSRG